MAIQFTLNKAPQNASVRDQCGLPFSCVLEPFAKFDGPCISSASVAVTAEDIGRCAECYAYVNYWCSFQQRAWSCSLCGACNEYSISKNQRYARTPRESCPEVRRSVVEVACAVEDNLPQEIEGPLEVEVTPVYVALVDTTGGEEYLELVKSALLAALEALPAPALFGLATYSDQIQLFDVEGGVTSIRSVPILEMQGSPTPVDLQDALPLEAFLAPVASCKDAIASALETLDPYTQDERDNGVRGFGSALQAILRYLGASLGASQQDLRAERLQSNSRAESSGRQEQAPVSSLGRAGARLMTFLAGAPDFGRGAVLQRHNPPHVQQPPSAPAIYEAAFPDINPYSYSSISQTSGSAAPVSMQHQNGKHDSPKPQWVRSKTARAFYEEAATAAAALGVSVDIYAMSSAACGLDALEPLASRSGGIMYLYPHVDAAALPQDVYRRLAEPCAQSALLRLRTSPEFEVVRAYGHLFPDDRFDNLCHVIAAGPSTAFAFDFDFAEALGFSGDRGSPPMLQMAFQYSVVVPTTANGKEAVEANGNAKAHAPQRCVLQRRLRILTVRLEVAKLPAEVYASADADAILLLLFHKISIAAAAQGASEGRALLQDWLVLFTTSYNRHQNATLTSADQVDAEFAGSEAMQPLPRLVYALLRSPLLTEGKRQKGEHSDLRAAICHLWACLPPPELRSAVYPLLSSFSNPDTLAYPRHSLSRAALITSGVPIFLLIAFTEVIVYYAAGAPPELPFPPPQTSLLRRDVNAVRAARRLTPQLRMLREGIDDVAPFMRHLIEEPEMGVDGKVAFPGIVQFLYDVQMEVWEYLNEQGYGK